MSLIFLRILLTATLYSVKYILHLQYFLIIDYFQFLKYILILQKLFIIYPHRNSNYSFSCSYGLCSNTDFILRPYVTVERYANSSAFLQHPKVLQTVFYDLKS